MGLEGGEEFLADEGAGELFGVGRFVFGEEGVDLVGRDEAGGGQLFDELVDGQSHGVPGAQSGGVMLAAPLKGSTRTEPRQRRPSSGSRGTLVGGAEGPVREAEGVQAEGGR